MGHRIVRLMQYRHKGTTGMAGNAETTSMYAGEPRTGLVPGPIAWAVEASHQSSAQPMEPGVDLVPSIENAGLFSPRPYRTERGGYPSQQCGTVGAVGHSHVEA